MNHFIPTIFCYVLSDVVDQGVPASHRGEVMVSPHNDAHETLPQRKNTTTAPVESGFIIGEFSLTSQLKLSHLLGLIPLWAAMLGAMHTHI